MIAIESTSTRTPRPSARGPCWLLCSVADLVPKSMDPERASGWGAASSSGSSPPRHAPRGHQHGDRAGYFAAWPTWSPSRWTQRELQVGGPLRARGRVRLDANRASISRGTVLATLQRGRLGPQVDGPRESFRLGGRFELGVESASTRTARPTARGPCWLLCSVADLVPKSMDPERASGWAAASSSGSSPPRREPRVHQHGDRAGYFAAWPTWSPSRWTQRELQVGRPLRARGRVRLDANRASNSTGTVLATLQRGRLGPQVDGPRESFRLGGRFELGVESASTRTARPTARGPCWLLCSVVEM